MKWAIFEVKIVHLIISIAQSVVKGSVGTKNIGPQYDTYIQWYWHMPGESVTSSLEMMLASVRGQAPSLNT